MKMEDMVMISVDDHIIEPPDVCTKLIATKYKDQAPHVFRFENGDELWVLQGKCLPTFAPSAQSGRKCEELGAEATRYDRLRRRHYDVWARFDKLSSRPGDDDE